jgi:hypothetical protein
MIRKVNFLLLVFFAFFFNVARSQVTSYAFTAGTTTYTSVSGGISPVLTGNGTDPVIDEGYANNIPIGFTFNYLGANYTTIGASTNGFASFAAITTPGFSNSLSTGGTGRLILAPLWEDLAIASAADMKYITSGAEGNRVFILQWSNVLYDFGAGAASVSFQLRLYETTNVIEFVYNQLAGTVQNFSGGASIGITSASTGSGSFLSLNNSSASPIVSSVVAANTIISRPAAGQVYTFSPPACTAPGNLFAMGITAGGATLSWTDGSATAFEYAVTTNAIPPVSGTVTAFTSTMISGLAAGTQYYLHVRKDCSGTFSGWASYAFATLCDAVNTPYVMPVSGVNAPGLPLCVIASDDNMDGNTWRSYPSAGPGWTDQVVAYAYNTNCTTPANDWLFTRGMNLTAGTTYRLKFKYNNDGTSLYIEKLKVAYGINPAGAAMTNMLADYPSVYNITPQTATIDFTPAASGVQYIGFQAYSAANKDVLILDDISVVEKPACDLPGNLLVDLQAAGTSANITWEAPSTGSPAGYEYAVTSGNTPPASGIASPTANVVVSDLTASAKYYLYVRANCGGIFSDWATLEFTTVANDMVCKAIVLTAGAAAKCGNTTFATSADDIYFSCSVPNNTVWYKYTATVTGTIVLTMTTPAAPAKPLRGWVAWYARSGANCPNISLYEIGNCQQFGVNGNNDTTYIISPVLTAGNTYYIMIDGDSGDYGEFCISIPACSPATAVKVDNILSTSAMANWAGTGSFILEYGPAGFIPGTGADAGTGGTIINPAVSPQVINGLTLSTAYNIYIRQNCSATANGYSNNSMVTAFTTLGPPPPNDNCSGAINLTVFNGTCGGATAGTTLDATGSAVTPIPACGNGSGGYDDDVWYSFTPSAGQQFVNIDFTLTGGNADVVAQLYTSSDNTCQGTFSLFDCSDDEGPGEMPGFQSLPVTAGTTYFIRVFSFSKGVSSQFTICITKALLINDNASGAIYLTVDGGCTGAEYTNVGATQSVGEPSGSCSSARGYATAWYQFVAPSGGAVRISTATGSGNSLTNTRVALFSTNDVDDYSMFSIIACDEDGGSGQQDNMSVLYATGLNANGTYYIQVDKYDSLTADGTFCITIDRLTPAMLSADNTCNSTYQTPVGNIANYTGWVPLMDANSKLVALARNTSGGAANAYSVLQNVNTSAVRKDDVSGEYYLNRNYKITNATTGSTSIQIQLFFTTAELTALRAKDSAATLSRLRVTRQTGTDCQPDFIAANGVNSELSQMSNGTQNGVSWIRFNTNGFSNFYIHSVRSRLITKIFLQGAYSAAVNRHKDVTTLWAGMLNTNATNQPFNTTAFGNYTGTETVAPGIFTSTADTTDIIDWILIELKNSSGSTTVLRRAALIREDGLIVDLDGATPLSLYGVSGNYNIIVRHRNHLSIRTGSVQPFIPAALGTIFPLSSYDFTTAQNKAYQNSAITTNTAMKDLGDGKFGLWAGNANSNTTVRASGNTTALNDFLYLINTVLAGNNGVIASNVYNSADMNMDGQVRASGVNGTLNDFLFLVNTVLNGNSATIYTEHQ